MTDFLKLTQEAFDASSAYADSNYRTDWEYSIRAFRNEHAAGSKYLSPEYSARSRIFPPKTRSIIRKNEAAAANALFSNMEIVNIAPGNPDDVMSVASAAAIKEVVEYRLSRTIPAFPLVMGAVQDAQTMGAVVSYQYWEYEQRNGKKMKDKPCIELRPIENIRMDGAANWMDPVNTSPYFCDIIPMYVCEVRAMMKNKDEKTGAPKWKTFEDSVILQARPDVMDTTRKARLGKQQDPIDETSGIQSFDIVWVMRWFMRDSQSDDFTYYTLGTEDLLTDPKPLDEVYFHGKRPYVMGYAILETHKAMKSSVPTLIRPLQQESADVRNQRLDNVKFVLNKRWIVARGRQVDVQSLVRNVPGGVTLTTDPNTDIKESNWPDVTSSAYIEQDRINSDLDDLAGNFTPSTKVANNAVNDTLGGSRMAAQGAGMMTDYLLRTIIETWWEPVLRQLVLLEQYYETDEVVLGICANKARLFPRFGISAITDDLLMQEVNVSVNVGMGSTNPAERMSKFLAATNAVVGLMSAAPPGFNIQEASKEIYSNAGYRDGQRFLGGQQDPRLLKAMQTIQQLQGLLEGKQMELASTERVKAAEIQSNEKLKGAEIQVNYARIQGDLGVRKAELILEEKSLDLERLKIAATTQGQSQEQQRQIEDQVRDAERMVKDAAHNAQLERERDANARQLEKKQLDSDIDTAIAQVQRIADNIVAKTTSMHQAHEAKAKARSKEGEAAKADKDSKESAQVVGDMQRQLLTVVGGLKEALTAKKSATFIKDSDGAIVGAQIG